MISSLVINSTSGVTHAQLQPTVPYLEDQAFEGFSTKLLDEKQQLDQHLATISTEEKTALLELNLQGGSDPTYRLENCFIRVFEGEKIAGQKERSLICKAWVATALLDTIHQIRNGLTHLLPFWGKPSPIHA